MDESITNVMFNLRRRKDREVDIPRMAPRVAKVEPASSTGARKHILTCAARLFRKLGYAAVSLRDVAAEAGVTTGSLYHHFGSKDELVRALLEQGYSDILVDVKAALEATSTSQDTGSSLREALKAHLACLLATDSFPAANVRIHAHVPEHLRKATLKGRRTYERLWIDLLRSYANEGYVRANVEPKALVMILFGAMNWSLEWFKPGRDDLDTFADDLLRLVLADD